MIKVCRECKYNQSSNFGIVCINTESMYYGCQMYHKESCQEFVYINKEIPIENKPPLGIIPSSLYFESRIKELKNAIKRYLDSDNEVNQEWIIEYNAIINMLKHIGKYRNGKCEITYDMR